jgi:hypothetical protein
MQSVQYDQEWVRSGSGRQDELEAAGWKVYALDPDNRKVLMGKRKPNMVLNTADDYAAAREAQRKRDAEAQMRWEIQQRLAEPVKLTKAQRHRERLERQGDRA